MSDAPTLDPLTLPPFPSPARELVAAVAAAFVPGATDEAKTAAREALAQLGAALAPPSSATSSPTPTASKPTASPSLLELALANIAAALPEDQRAQVFGDGDERPPLDIPLVTLGQP